LSGANWTDYNEHDPGVTIFENIAYTLTNLSYKVNLPIEDILTESKNKAFEVKNKDYFLKTRNRTQRKPTPLKSGDNGFFVASEILTTNPVIKEDYRKMFVDGIQNVKNVWVKTHSLEEFGNTSNSQKQNLRGLYHIFVEMYDYHEDMAIRHTEENRIINKVKQLFHAHRNLCEDIYQVTILQPFLLDLKLELTLDVAVDGEDVFAQVYYNVNDYLTHEARFQSLWELRQEKENINSIYQGPTLSNGFMKDKELQPRKNKIYLSEITKIISKVAGVVSIDKFEIKEDYSNKPSFEYEITIPEQKSPRLNIPATNEKLIFKTADIALKPDVREIKKRYVSIEAEHYGTFKTVSESTNMSQIPEGESLGISSFYSIREQFPAIYGIGQFGLPKTVSKKRKAQAKQLKAYLLPFDQLMSNFLAQLTNLYTLYDVHKNGIQTYFHQELEDMPDLAELIKVDPKNQKEPLDQWADTLIRLNSQFDSNAIRRLNEVADNLLARFAEQFPTYVLQKINTSCFGKHFTDQDFDKKLLSWKRKLIANYGRLSYNRAKTFDYTTNQDSNTNIPTHQTSATIVEKISILLGIHHSETRDLSAFIDHTKITPKLILEEEIIFLRDDEIFVLEKLVEGIKDRLDLTGENEVRMNDILSLGVVQSNYGIQKKDKGGKTYNIVLKKDGNPDNNIQLMSGLAKKDLEIAQGHSLKFLKKMNEKSEGIHLIEHLLLAPPIRGAYFGFSFGLKLSNNEIITFKQTKLLDNNNRNRFVHSLTSKLEEGSKVKFKRSGEQGDFRIEIYKTENRPLTISTAKYVTIKEVENVIDSLEKIQDSNVSFEITERKYYAYYDDDKIVDESFFSFSMSFILPSWPVRFQQESFQKQFSNILYQHAPIHIQYQSHWLCLSKMRAFEKTYFSWLRLLSKDEMIHDRMPVAYELVQKIKEYRNLPQS
ncbi:MAG: hypothetical protein JKY22_11265, partial [Flavobacteriaceae bacterium]|nr:hypothetical protein [Flavobacteriaceae bacterium]